MFREKKKEPNYIDEMNSLESEDFKHVQGKKPVGFNDEISEIEVDTRLIDEDSISSLKREQSLLTSQLASPRKSIAKSPSKLSKKSSFPSPIKPPLLKNVNTFSEIEKQKFSSFIPEGRSPKKLKPNKNSNKLLPQTPSNKIKGRQVSIKIEKIQKEVRKIYKIYQGAKDLVDDQRIKSKKMLLQYKRQFAEFLRRCSQSQEQRTKLKSDYQKKIKVLESERQKLFQDNLIYKKNDQDIQRLKSEKKKSADQHQKSKRLIENLQLELKSEKSLNAKLDQKISKIQEESKRYQNSASELQKLNQDLSSQVDDLEQKVFDFEQKIIGVDLEVERQFEQKKRLVEENVFSNFSEEYKKTIHLLTKEKQDIQAKCKEIQSAWQASKNAVLSQSAAKDLQVRIQKVQERENKVQNAEKGFKDREKVLQKSWEQLEKSQNFFKKRQQSLFQEESKLQKQFSLKKQSLEQKQKSLVQRERELQSKILQYQAFQQKVLKQKTLEQEETSVRPRSTYNATIQTSRKSNKGLMNNRSVYEFDKNYQDYTERSNQFEGNQQNFYDTAKFEDREFQKFSTFNQSVYDPTKHIKYETADQRQRERYLKSKNVERSPNRVYNQILQRIQGPKFHQLKGSSNLYEASKFNKSKVEKVAHDESPQFFKPEFPKYLNRPQNLAQNKPLSPASSSMNKKNQCRSYWEQHQRSKQYRDKVKKGRTQTVRDYSQLSKSSSNLHRTNQPTQRVSFRGYGGDYHSKAKHEIANLSQLGGKLDSLKAQIKSQIDSVL